MSAHAKLSPSAAARWLSCTAAPQMEAQFPYTTSPYAEEGSFAHRLAELETAFAIGRFDEGMYQRQLAELKKDDHYSSEMHDYVLEYATYIKERLADLKKTCPDPEVGLEIKLDLTAFIPEGFGTADCIIVADGSLYVVDFKYGKGVKVEAEDNAQMKIYAAGAYHLYAMLYDIDTVYTVIVQPRIGGISEASISADDLIAWIDNVLVPTAEIAAGDEGEFNPSESACRFCRAAGSCRPRADYYTALYFDNPSTLMTDDYAAELLQKADGMKDWLKALEERIFSALMDGKDIPGWKIVEGRSTRKYADEEALEKALRAKGYKVKDIFEKKLLGISKMEKLVGKKKLAEIAGDLIIKPKGSPTLAPETDKRPVYHPEEKIMEAFDDD